MTTDATLKLELFPTARIVSPNSSATLPAELITPDIAIVPALNISDGAYTLGGGFGLTHVASGWAITPEQACIECARECARRLTATSVRWGDIDGPENPGQLQTLIGDQHEAVADALRLFRQCGQQMCFHDEPCEVCGGTRQHASYCIYVVGPMVVRANHG